MKRFILLAALCVCDTANAQKNEIPKQVDRQEIDRRGAMVERLGEISNGEIDIIADALKPPENDSAKWFIFVITKDNDANSELLKKHFGTQHLKDGTDNPLRSWAMPDEPSKSYAHYNVLRIEDSDPQKGVFKDWFSGIRENILKGTEAKGFPVIILQPPKNGKFGPNKTVAAMLFGYDGDVSKLCNSLRFAQQSYIASVIKSGHLSEYLQSSAEIARENEGAKGTDTNTNFANVGSAQSPPFNVPTGPFNPLVPNGGDVDIPPIPQALTLEQLQGLLPGAPAEYILNVLRQRPLVNQMSNLQMQWLQDKTKLDEEAKRKAADQASNPTIPVKDTMTTLLMLLASGNILGIVGTGLLLYRHFKKATGQKMILDDSQFNLLLHLLGVELPAPPVVPSVAPSVPGQIKSPLLELLKAQRAGA